MNHSAETEKLVADGAEQDLARHIIEFDPRRASHYLFAAAPDDAEAEAMAQAVLHPDPVPWPPGTAPTPTRPATPPGDTDRCRRRMCWW